MIKIIEITDDLREKYNSCLLKFEQHFAYPFGQDSFTINHGSDYFKFFDSLGKPYILIVLDNDEIIGIVTLVLRNIDILNIGILERVWYICDLKIHPDYRGKGIITKISEFALKNYSKFSSKIYGVSMNSKSHTMNRLGNVAKRLTNINLTHQETLVFYLLNITQLNQISYLLKSHFTEFSYLSLLGIKDLIMRSTNEPMPLIHIVPNKKPNLTTQMAHSSFMFCLPLSNPLINKLTQVDINYGATASVISNIEQSDWNFILSSEI